MLSVWFRVEFQTKILLKQRTRHHNATLEHKPMLALDLQSPRARETLR